MFRTIIYFIQKSVDLLKENYRLLLPIIGAYSIILFAFQAFQAYITAQEEGAFKVGLGLLDLALIVAFVYYSSRVNITILLMINKIINKQEVSAIEEYNESKSIFRAYFGAVLTLVAYLLIPIIAFIIATVIPVNAEMKMFFMTVAVVIGIYIMLNYSMSTTISVLMHNEGRYFERSKKLFNSNKVLMILSLVFTSLLMAIPAFIPDLLLDGIMFFGFINSNLIVVGILNMVIMPISVIFTVYILWHMVENYNHLYDSQEKLNDNKE